MGSLHPRDSKVKASDQGDLSTPIRCLSEVGAGTPPPRLHPTPPSISQEFIISMREGNWQCAYEQSKCSRREVNARGRYECFRKGSPPGRGWPQPHTPAKASFIHHSTPDSETIKEQQLQIGSVLHLSTFKSVCQYITYKYFNPSYTNKIILPPS